MRNNRIGMLLGCLLAGADLAPLAAHANIIPTVVSMELTGVQGSSLDGVYTDPYYARISQQDLTQPSQFNSQNSVAATIYCDDYFDSVSTGQVWQAQITNLGSLSSTSALQSLMFDTSNAAQQEQDYMEAAWLVEQIGGQTHSQQADEQMSYAIWGIFDPNLMSYLQSHDSSTYQAALTFQGDAKSGINGLTAGDFSNVNVYTPLDNTPGSAGSQEYLTVSTPEPSTLSLAAAGLAAIGFAVRRRRRLVPA